jgi:methylglyoxal synthase
MGKLFALISTDSLHLMMILFTQKQSPTLESIVLAAEGKIGILNNEWDCR